MGADIRRKRPLHMRQLSLNRDWQKKARTDSPISSPLVGKYPNTFTPSATAQELVEEVWRIKEKESARKVDHFTAVAKKIDSGKISLEGDNLLSVIFELGQAIDWLDGSEKQALAFNMLAGIVEKIPSNRYRLRGIEILAPCLHFIDRSCYLDPDADDEENLLRAQRLADSLDRLIGMVENFGENNDAQARAGIVVAAMLILPDRGMGNIERFIRMAEIFKRTERGDLKVQSIHALADQIDSIIAEDDDLFEQVLKDLDRAAESIGSLIETIRDPDVRKRLDKEVIPKFKSLKKAWELMYAARLITGEELPDIREMRFTGIVRKLEDREIPLHANDLIDVVFELGSAIEYLDGTRSKAYAFDMLAGIVEGTPSSTEQMRGARLLARCLIAIDRSCRPETYLDEYAQFLAGSFDMLIGIVEKYGEDKDAQAEVGIVVAEMLSLLARGIGNAGRFIRLAKLFKRAESEDLKIQGINTLAHQIDSIVVYEDDASFAQVSEALDRVAESIDSAIETIKSPVVEKQVRKEVMPKIMAQKKAGKWISEIQKIKEGKIPDDEIGSRFDSIVNDIEDEEMSSHDADLLLYSISELRNTIKKLPEKNNKPKAFKRLAGIVVDKLTGADWVRGIKALAPALRDIDDISLVGELVDLVEGTEEDNDTSARAAIAVLSELVAWPAETGINLFIRMAGIFEYAGNNDLAVQGLEALVNQIGSVVENRASYRLARESLERIVDSITNEEARQQAGKVVKSGFNALLEGWDSSDTESTDDESVGDF